MPAQNTYTHILISLTQQNMFVCVALSMWAQVLWKGAQFKNGLSIPISYVTLRIPSKQ